MMPNNLSAKLDDVDINDVFDEILFSEEKVIEQGYQQGFATGSSEDSIEGYHLGYHRGAELGAELGYYQAFAEHYLDDPHKFKVSVKTLKNIEALNQGCKEFPRINSESIDLFELADKFRGLYKKICTQLKVKTNFQKEGVNF